MNVLVVLAHPEPKSFNGVIRDKTIQTLSQAGHSVRQSDLYAMGFNPVGSREDFLSVKTQEYFSYAGEQQHAHAHASFTPEIAAEQEKLTWCDLLILQFPLWWYSMPAILKGWIDRVFAYGFAYGGGRWFDRGVFTGKKAMLVITVGGMSSAYEPDSLQGDIDQILFPIHRGILQYCGFDVLPPFVAYASNYGPEDEKNVTLQALDRRLEEVGRTEPIPAPRLADFDHELRPLQPSGLRDELYQLVRSIPNGRCTTYGALGHALTTPVSGKIIGNWMASCPSDIPWWRVVAKGGAITTWRRDPRLGLQQEELLKSEGISVVEGKADLERHGWMP